MVAIPTQTVNKVIKDFQSEIDDFILIAKGNLEDLRDKGILTNAEKSFVIKILTYDIRKIILASPTELDLFVKKIGKVPKQRATKQGKRFKSLKDEIVERLGYSSLRSSFYPKYFQKIGIKACVYCNSQLTVSTESIKKINKKKIRYIKTYKAKFQVDHYYPKVEYPYLSISLFNLYPVCASCNNSKSDKELIFELYSDNPTKLNKSDFEFSFVDGSVARYKTSKDIDDIEFTFNEPISIKNSFQKLFDIQGIYNTQKDIAEELIRKSEIYTESYKKTLTTTFPQMFDNNSISNRLIVGNYVEPENIHKRPMAKFMQDLANQLELTIK